MTWQDIECHKATVRVTVAACAGEQQPVLAVLRKNALNELMACADALAAWERESEMNRDDLQFLHDKFYAWLWANLDVITDGARHRGVQP